MRRPTLFGANEREKKLDEILKEYEEIRAEKEARSLIPSQEVWRLFVDGKQQEKGKNLAGYFSGDIPDSTIKAFAQKEAGEGDWLFSPFMNFLREKNWRLSAAECEQLTVSDLLGMDKAWTQYENEAGYTRALYNAFQNIFDFSADVDINFIKMLHRAAVNDVRQTNYDEEQEEDKIGEFRKTDSMTLGFRESNCSIKGLLEILERANPYLFFSITFYDSESGMSTGSLLVNQECVKAIRQYVADLKETSNKNPTFPLVPYLESHDKLEFIKKVKSDENIRRVLSLFAETENNDQVAECLYQFVVKPPVSDCDIRLQSTQPKRTTKTLNEEMKKLLDDYQSAIVMAKAPMDRLRAILTLVQSAHQLHPFADGNGRTLCILSLNHLLMRNGFPPVILEDISMFNGKSLDELVQATLKGMHNTLDLIQHKVLYNVDTDEFVKWLASGKGTATYAEDFLSAVERERENRVTYTREVSHAK